MSESERDIRDVARSYLNARSLDEYYKTLYPQPEPGTSPWGPVSNLNRDEIRKALIAYHLRRKWRLNAPAAMVDDYLRLVVSNEAMGREQAVRTHVGETKRKASVWSRLWPFGNRGDGDSQA